MSTPATAKSTYLKSLIGEFAKNCQVLRLGCDGLEEAIEYWQTGDIARLLDKECPKINQFGADVTVLGCTHFPFVKDLIRKRLGPKVKIIDSGQSIAQRVKYLLTKNKNLADRKSPDTYFTTSDPAVFSKVASTLLKYKVMVQKAII